MKKLRSTDPWRTKLVWHLKGLGGITSVVSAVVALAALASEMVRGHIGVVALFGVHWVLLAHLVRCILEHECPKYFGNPKVKHVMRDDGLLIVERSPWLGIDVATSVYRVQDDFERLVCAGHVINIQQNGLVQIRVSCTETGLPSWNDVWNELGSKSADSLIVRPGLHQGRFSND